MADMELELADVVRYRPDASHAVVAALVTHYGIALLNPQADSALVAASDASECARLRDNFVKKKLGRAEADEVLDEAIQAVLAEMAGDSRKRRVTASYLLAERFDALSIFG